MKKTIDIQYKDIVDGEMQNALKYLSDSIDFPVMFSLKIAKIEKFINDCTQDIRIVQEKLIRKYGAEDPETKKLIIKNGTDEHFKYLEEMKNFLDEKIICNHEKLNILEIKDYKIKPSYLKKILKLVLSDNI